MLDKDDIKDGELNDWLDDIDDAAVKANGDVEKWLCNIMLLL